MVVHLVGNPAFFDEWWLGLVLFDVTSRVKLVSCVAYDSECRWEPVLT